MNLGQSDSNIHAHIHVINGRPTAMLTLWSSKLLPTLQLVAASFSLESLKERIVAQTDRSPVSALAVRG